MKKIILLSLFFVTNFLFANDTYFFTSGGNLIPAEESDVSVQMKSEVINLVFQPEYYEVTVDFNFYNTGSEVELLTGFPIFEEGSGDNGKIYDFKCWTDGKLTDYSDKPLENTQGNKSGILEKAYTRKINFPSKSTTKTKVYYKAEYGRDSSSYIAQYLYGTGSSWKDKIGEMTLIIENNLPYHRPDEFVLPDENTDFKRISDNKWEAHFYNVEPDYTDCITILLKDIIDNTGPKKFPLYGYRFQDDMAEQSWLFWYTKPQLRILRNTIYALHGYPFESDDLKELFTKWGAFWYPEYKENPDFSEDELSEIEKHNIDLILKEEQRRK